MNNKSLEVLEIARAVMDAVPTQPKGLWNPDCVPQLAEEVIRLTKENKCLQVGQGGFGPLLEDWKIQSVALEEIDNIITKIDVGCICRDGSFKCNNCVVIEEWQAKYRAKT